MSQLDLLIQHIQKKPDAPPSAPALDGDKDYCHRCDRVTAWRPVRGKRRLACEGCGDLYPCRHACNHLDCAQTRTEG